MKLKVRARLKGGPGSGHYGHAGRPGKVGGSAPSHRLAGEVDNILDVHWEAGYGSGYFVVGDEHIVDVGLIAHIDHILRHPEDKYAYGLTDEDYVNIQHHLDESSLSEAYNALADATDEIVRVRSSGWFTYINTNQVDNRNLRRLQKLFDANKIRVNYGQRIMWESYYVGDEPKLIITSTLEDFLSSKYIGQLIRQPVEKQLPIDDAAKRNLFQVRLDIFTDASDILAEQVFTGDISIDNWESQMRTLVKEMHTSAAAIGKGGWDDVSFQEWGRLGTPMRQQYKHLNNFAQDIADGMDDISLGSIRARARMYGRAAGYVAALMQAPKEILDQLPWIPKDGSTECLTNCRCVWVLKVISKIEAIQKIQAKWWMREAEHCDDCPERNGHIETFEVDANIQVPSIIGGF